MTDLNKEREAFEQHLIDTGLVEFAGYGFEVDECDEYTHEPTNVAWGTWVIGLNRAKAQAVPEGYVLIPKVPSAEWTESFISKKYAEHCEKYANSPWPILEEEKPDFENCFRKDIRRSHELIMKVLQAAGDQNEKT